MAREGWSILCLLGLGGSGCAEGVGKMGTTGPLAAPTRLQGSWGWGGWGSEGLFGIHASWKKNMAE